MPLTVAYIVPCPPWRMLAWATALVATLAVGCSQADVDLSDFNLSCTAAADCPDSWTCGAAGICVDGGVGDPPEESFGCRARCGAWVESCDEDDAGTDAERQEFCQLICEFIVAHVDPEIAGCVFDRFDGELCDPAAALTECAPSACRDDSACTEFDDRSSCTFIGGDEAGVCAQPTQCGDALRCAERCAEGDDGKRADCAVDCLDILGGPPSPDGPQDTRALRAGVVALACEADCGQDPQHPVCDQDRHEEGDCEWPQTVCSLGGANDDFACRDIVSCMLNTCNDSSQGCRDLCGGGPVVGQQWPDSHPAGWPALDGCMDQKCSPDDMSAEDCFREECGDFVERDLDEGAGTGCGYPIHHWPPEQPPDCWGVYDCFVGCFEAHLPGDERAACKRGCGAPALDDDRRRATTLFGCMQTKCAEAEAGLFDEDCANQWCGQQLSACQENRDPPMTPCVEVYFCLEACRAAGAERACEDVCFDDRPERDVTGASRLISCMQDNCAADRRNLRCAQLSCPDKWSTCNNFMGLDCDDSWDCGGDQALMCATDSGSDRYCTMHCENDENDPWCPGQFTCVAVTTDEGVKVAGCRRPAVPGSD